MRLDKYLADCGYGTRKEIKKLIKSGAVTVSSLEKPLSESKIDENSDKVFVMGEEAVYKKFVYLMLNKPQGVVSATFDAKLSTVIDLIPPEYSHYKLFPVGRLDIDTEGLLIITNDGGLNHRLLSPKSHVPKTYFAKISGCVNNDDITAFKNGVALDDGYITKPAELKIISRGEISEIELTIFEGKFHQVKRMFESVNKKVLSLKRTKMNKLCLDETLENGEMRELTNDELNLLCSGIIID